MEDTGNVFISKHVKVLKECSSVHACSVGILNLILHIYKHFLVL